MKPAWGAWIAAGLMSLTMLSLAACDKQDNPVAPPTAHDLVLLRSLPLAVPEPSDLCLDPDGLHAWTVSDNTGLVYRLRLSDGAVVQTLSFHGSDLEGISQHPTDGTLYVTEEGAREVVHLDSSGNELGRVYVAGLGGDVNSGLEGVASGPVTARQFVVQEKGPARIVEIDSTGAVLAMHLVTFVADLSGITYDAGAGQLLVVSDESAKVCRTTLAGVLLDEWAIPVEKAEGVAFDRVHGLIYVVSDSQNRLYEFRVP